MRRQLPTNICSVSNISWPKMPQSIRKLTQTLFHQFHFGWSPPLSPPHLVVLNTFNITSHCSLDLLVLSYLWLDHNNKDRPEMPLID